LQPGPGNPAAQVGDHIYRGAPGKYHSAFDHKEHCSGSRRGYIAGINPSAQRPIAPRSDADGANGNIGYFPMKKEKLML